MKLNLNIYNLLIGIYFLSFRSLTHGEDLTKEYSSYRRNPVCNPSSYIRYPKTEQDVVDIVKEAISSGQTVKAFGVRHSQTDIICTEGIPIDNQGLRFFKMHDDGVTATIGSGVNLREATQFLKKNGRGLRTTPAYGNITIGIGREQPERSIGKFQEIDFPIRGPGNYTIKIDFTRPCLTPIGGALGTGAHGSSIKYNASLSSQVVAVRIVDGKGEIQDISDPEDLKAFKIHLGLLGIILKATFETVPLYKTRAHNHVVSDEILTNGVAINMAKTTDQLSLYWFPTFEEVVVANWTIVDVTTPGNAYTYDHVPSAYPIFTAIATTAKEAAFSLTSSACALANSVGYTILHVIEYYLQLSLFTQTPLFVPIYTEDGVTVQMPAVGYYDVMFAPVCYDTPQGILGEACVWDHAPNNITVLDNEFSLDLAEMPNFIADIKAIIKKAPTAFPVQGILMRFSDKSDIYMSTSYGRQSVHFEFYLWNRKDPYNQPSGSLAGYQTILQMLRDKYTSRSHWGKSGLVYHDSESLDIKIDPVARKNFIAAMDKFDPDEVFMNNFGRRIKGKGTKVDIDPKVTRCALLDNCICSKDSDCGKNQICTTVSGYKYYVCKTRNELPGASPNKNWFPKGAELLELLSIHSIALETALNKNCSISTFLNSFSNVPSNTFKMFYDGIGPGVHESINGALGGLTGIFGR